MFRQSLLFRAPVFALSWNVSMFSAEHHWVAHYGPLDAAEQRFVRQVQRLVQVQCGRARMRALWEEGAALTLGQAVQAALSAGRPITPLPTP